MAQVKFYGMLLDFPFVRDNYAKPSFSRLIFQPYMPDSLKWEDEYLLLVYAMNENGEVIGKQDLSVVMDDPFDAPQRLDLGNIAMTKLQLQGFIEEDGSGTPLKALYLKPYQYGEYVAYTVTGIQQKSDAKIASDSSGSVTDTQEDIKPSPPAPPVP